MKHKNIEAEYLILCLDRLTRFKPTATKYERVFNDILNKYCPSCHDFNFAKEIFNNSVSLLTDLKNDVFWNELLKTEEEEMFFQSAESKKFFPLNLNIEGVLSLAESKEDLPENLKRLLVLRKNKNTNPKILREKFALSYPVQKIILTEGITEEILLCEFAKCLNLDFKKEGIRVLGAGGKNQVARKYYKMVEEVKLPIFILLDADAKETRELILPRLRAKDSLYLIKSGEFEDIIPREIIINTINSIFNDRLQINNSDFEESLTTVKNLKEIYKHKGFGDFQKADFAKNLKQFLNEKTEIQGELKQITEKIAQL